MVYGIRMSAVVGGEGTAAGGWGPALAGIASDAGPAG